MKKYIFACLTFMFFAPALVAVAAVPLPYTTSFTEVGCSEGFNLSSGSGCAGFVGGGNGGACSLDSMVYAGANNPLGSGRGVRHFVNDGKNAQGRTFSLYFDKLYQNLWVRFYIKYPLGFKWNYLQEHKLLWIADALPGTNARVFSLAGGNRFRFWNQKNTDGNEVVYSAEGNGWNVLVDGNWHAVEAHLKYGTSGEEHIWLDGKQILSKTGVSMVNDRGGFGAIEFGVNADAPGNGGCVGYDIDDIAISATGYIGPVNKIVPPTTKKGDINNSGKVDISDLGIFLSNWGPSTGSGQASDLNQDGRVDITDLGILLSNWG